MTEQRQFDPTNLPPPLSTGEPNSFAHSTLTTRKPSIISNILADFADQYPAHTLENLQDLTNEITQNQPIRPLQTNAADGNQWAAAWQAHQGETWLNTPWFFAETFFYRRLLEAVGYFNNGDWAGADPFLPRKQAELNSAAPWLIAQAALAHSAADSADSFRLLLHYCLWGNRVDLSYTQVAQTVGSQITLDHEQANLLADDTEPVLNHLRQNPPVNINFICDNSGTELLMDLALVDFLLRHNWASRITLHLKAHPTFVSDAMPADVELTLATLKTKQAADLLSLADRLQSYRLTDRLILQADSFWNSHHFFWKIPPTLQTQLGQAHLVIIKGDANYRRLLSDSRWPADIPLRHIAPWFPAPFVTLRTMKSDPVVGLKPGQAEALDQIDPKWRVNGKRGLIQACL
jgi:uncharacterized protein with ATP-grasp and redox domains